MDLQNSQTIALFLAGLAAPFITNLVKSDKITGAWAAWLALVVSVGCAGLALLLTGGLIDALADPTAMIKDIGMVMTLATLVYHSFPGGTPTAIQGKGPEA